MPNPFEKLKKKFSIVMNLRPSFTSKYQAQVDEQEGPSDAVPIPEEEPAVVMHMQEEEPVAEVASPEKITELLNIVLKHNEILVRGDFQAELSSTAVASAELIELRDGLRRLVELNVIAEVTFELKAAYASQYVVFNASLQAFAKASFDFRVNFMDIKQGVIIDANFTADARAAVIAKASAEVRIFKLGELGADVAGSAEAYAIAEASVSGSLSITKAGITMSGNVMLGAKAGVSIEGTASISFKGTKLISLCSKLEAQAGAAAELGGSFSFKEGRLIISLDFGLTAGLGGAIHENLEVDFAAIKELIAAELATVGEELKAKINALLIEKMDILIAELEEEGLSDLLDPLAIDSETGMLNNTGAWNKILKVAKNPKFRKKQALLAAIETVVSLTGGKGVSGDDEEFPEQE